MGAGRKTFSYDVDTVGSTNFQFEQQQRNLQHNLGGVIFICNDRTMGECKSGLVFGLPAMHWCYVQFVQPGMPIFLFNVSKRELHGIYKAVSHGDWEINPSGWTTPGSRTQYPCQVQVDLHNECPALSERQFRPIIASNYIDKTDRFLQELTKKQAAELCSLFLTVQEKQGGRGVGGSVAALTQQLGALNPSTSAFVPSQGPASNPWASGAGAAVVATEPEPAKQPGAGAKTYAQIQEEEARKAEKAARAAGAKAGAGMPTASQRPAPVSAQRPQSTSSLSGSAPAAQQAAAANGATGWDVQQWSNGQGAQLALPAQAAQQAVQQQPVAAATASSQPAAAAAAAPQQQQQAPAKPKSAIDEMSDEIGSLKCTLNPLISSLHSTQVASQVSLASTLQQHLGRLDDALMKVQKERGRLVMANQEAATRLTTMAAELKVLRVQAQGAQQAAPSAAAPAAAAFASPGEELVLCGGNKGGWLDTVLIYTPGTNTWRQGPTMPSKRGYGGSVALGRQVYVMGGGNDQQWLQDTLQLDLGTGAWGKLADMTSARGSLGYVELGGKVYVMGGGRADAYYDTTEVFDPMANAWAPGPKMQAARFSTAAAALGGSIYAMGGYNGHQYLQSVERLDPREGRWQLVAEMSVKRGAHACAVAHGRLWCIGGYDANAFIAAVETYDARANRWQPAPGLSKGRAYGVAACVDGQLLMVGGMDQSEQVLGLERWDPAVNGWQEVLLPQQVEPLARRSFLSAAVVPRA